MRAYFFLLLLIISYSQLAYSEPELYFSGAVTKAKSDPSCDYIQETVVNHLYTHDCGDRASGWNINIGSKRGDNALELGFLNLGTAKSQAHFYGFTGEQTPEPQITSVTEFSASGLTLSYKRFFNISNSVKFYGRLSGFFYKAEGKTYQVSTKYARDEESVDSHDLSLIYSLGFQYKWLELSYSTTNDIEIDDFGDANINFYSVGLVKTF